MSTRDPREGDGFRVGVDGDPELRAELREAGPRARLVQPHAPRVAEHEVLEHGQCRDERRVLVDGADAVVERAARRRDDRLDAVDSDRPLVGARQTGEDPDQRRLAGAVLSEQAVDGAAAEHQVDVIVGEDARKRLRDSDELDDRWRWLGLSLQQVVASSGSVMRRHAGGA